MSETESKFQIEVDGETTLRRDDTVAHADLTADQARDLAATLEECADILDGEK